jgi:hypothetical protein
VPADLVLGPLLRYADSVQATIWVETSAPCEVQVRAGDSLTRAPTFTVHGHHYAIVAVDLPRPEAVPYTVELDGRLAWPPPDSEFPPSVIRPTPADTPLRLLFGSCRTSVPHDPTNNRRHGIDVLRAYARHLATLERYDRVDQLLLLGDQVYADATSDEMRQVIEARRDLREPPGKELADFEEYTQLYRIAWSEPANRWLLSTVPTAMMFDDHDLRDDWNTSHAWREQMNAQPWWRKRVIGGIAAYWLYQHLGNLSPDELATDPVLAAVRGAGEDAGDLLDEFAWQADREPWRNRWSYSRQLGSSRLVVIDTRCGRVLTPGNRAMLDDGEWSWLEKQIRGDVEHLLVGTSLPLLLPVGIHDVEAWSEVVCDGRWGSRAARVAEQLRQGLDLEHWAAFGTSFRAMAGLLQDTVQGRRGAPPTSVTVLSGDVHFSYLATVEPPGGGRFHQVVCSPIRNPLGRGLRLLNGLAQFVVARWFGRMLARSAAVPDPPFTWQIDEGPWFDNAMATVHLDREHAWVQWQAAEIGEDGEPRLRHLGAYRLTATVPETAARS